MSAVATWLVGDQRLAGMLAISTISVGGGNAPPPAGVRSGVQDELLEAFRAGDNAAWRKVLKEHGPRLLGYAARMLGASNRAQAQDVVQDSLVAALKASSTFEGKSSIKAWLFRIVHNRAIDELRRGRRFVSLDTPAGDDERGGEQFTDRGRWLEPPQWNLDLADQVDAKRLLAVVRQQMDTMPHAYRQILLLKEVHGLETAEICAALELTPGNARVMLHRARKALRAEVGRVTRGARDRDRAALSADEFHAAHPKSTMPQETL